MLNDWKAAINQLAILYEDRFTRTHNLNFPTITFNPLA